MKANFSNIIRLRPTENISIHIYKYIDFIKKHYSLIDEYANLDVIGKADASLRNQQIMEYAGFCSIPIYHYGEHFKYLQMYIPKYYHIKDRRNVSNNHKVINVSV